MRSYDETAKRWHLSRGQASSLSALRDVVALNPSAGPCVHGCRSLCWKAFLLFRRFPPTEPCLVELRRLRTTYDSRRARLLRLIEHPEELAKLAVDPLADDPDSPWNSLRKDETLLAEIRQDVCRLPDDPFYHQEAVQTLITNILFVYCRAHPRAGGYRQGMHELLAPIVRAVDCDAVDKTHAAPPAPAPSSDPKDDAATMADMLDADFVEHDSFAIFESLMGPAAAFYEVASDEHGQGGAIVERSRFIHQECLMRVDPELAAHLTAIEILPQIFLIRWIRLLFSREFPQDDVLILWDKLFALDPLLDSIDLMCVAMLLRIRWSLLEADYSVALQQLLKYPPPPPSHPPHTFVDDALFLRQELSSAAGAALILKYTGRNPSPSSPPTILSSFPGRSALRSGRSNLSHLSQVVSVDSLLQGAAQNVLERGERLGINQAVREAMDEIRRNVQNLQDTHFSPAATAQKSEALVAGGIAADAASALAAVERRNRQLAAMLSETIDSLRSVKAKDLDDKAKSLELIEMAAARAQFVKVYLEDSTIDVSAPALASTTTPSVVIHTKGQGTTIEDATRPVAVASAFEPHTANETETETAEGGVVATVISDPGVLHPPVPIVPDTLAHTTDAVKTPTTTIPVPVTGDAKPESPPTVTAAERPVLIPTRSTLAQSSFSWMLEPDQSPTTTGLLVARPTSRASAARQPRHGKKPSGSRGSRGSRGSLANRERNAFLFGEDFVEDFVNGNEKKASDEIFGLEPIKAAVKEVTEG